MVGDEIALRGGDEEASSALQHIAQIIADGTDPGTPQRVVNKCRRVDYGRDTKTDYRVVHVEDWIREDDSLPQGL